MLAGVERGWSAIVAEAAGYAEGQGLARIGESGASDEAPAEVAIVLRRGVAVSGRVTDEAGRPIPGARVRYETTRQWAEPAPDATATSDDRGEFAFAAVVPGRYILSAADGVHARGLSKPIDVADQPLRGVAITMKEGGAVAGVVVGKEGAAVPFAAVLITPRAGDDGMNGDLREAFEERRRATSDEHGRFEIKGLSRTHLQLRAEGEQAASAIVEVSLVEAPRRDQLRVVLDVEGTISGRVVDEHGEPVAEISVNAFPDMTAGASTAGLALTRTSLTTTDGSGPFTLRGLPEGPYRLWAVRSTGDGGWGKKSTSARTGDRDVRLTLATPGRLIGKLVGSDSKPPALATVLVSGSTPVTTRSGTFAIEELDPGEYDLTVHGPEHAERTLRDLQVAAGKDTDLGTIELVRGRRLTGRVVDAGKPPALVAGARVRAGKVLFSGGDVDGDRQAEVDRMQGVQSVITDATGAFELAGLPATAVHVAATHASGRSLALQVPAGPADPPPVTLQLRGYGSVAGVVTVAGKPAGRLNLSVTPKGDGMSAVFSSTGADGSYLVDRVPEGPQTVTVMRSGGMSMSGTSAQVAVSAGQRAKLDIDIKGGELTLVTPVSALSGQRVDAAQVFLFEGTVNATNGKALLERFTQGAIGMQFWFGGGSPLPSFKTLAPGSYTLCSLPITGDLSDPKLMQRLQQNMQALAVYCKPVKLAAAPPVQRFAVELPAMAPLPASSDSR